MQLAKPLKGTGEAYLGRRLLAKRGDASETDKQTCLKVQTYVFGTCKFVDVVYLFLHVVVRHQCSAPAVVRSRFLFIVCVSSKLIWNEILLKWAYGTILEMGQIETLLK